MTYPEGVSIINKLINQVGVSNTRYGASYYISIDGVMVREICLNRLRFEQGFINNETRRVGRTHPDIKTQIIDVNRNGSSPIVYSNKPGLSHKWIQGYKGLTHWCGSTDWSNNLDVGSSMGVATFSPTTSIIGRASLTLRDKP